MKAFLHDLSRLLLNISSSHQPVELPPEILCRQELLGIMARISSLNSEIVQLQTESATLKKHDEQISGQEFLYRSVFERAVVGIMVLSSDGTIINVNQTVEYMFGCPVDELKDMNLSDFTLPDDQAIDAELLQDVIEGSRNYYQIEKRYTRNDGILFWSLVTVFVVIDASGTTNLIHMLEDISARKSVELQLEQASTHDAMTGLYNRGYFDQEFSRLQYSMRLPVSIIVVDVDGLKQINDTQGHEAGDRLITNVAAILKETFRGDDTVARVGGDEFSVLLPETGEGVLQAVLERLHKCHLRFNESTPQSQVNFSTGSATAIMGNEIPKALKLADERMYADKILNKAARLAQAYSRQ
jgi:diguanylate cyclase (GGDEF)-like protein/PAS domain S-box-containing protein